MAPTLTRTTSESLQFQPHALVVASGAHGSCYGESDEQENRRHAAQELQWNADVIDLQRVMSIAQALFYLLEHNNEPLLRVAMEIVMDKQTVKSLWWDDGWYSDEDRRERFRKMVRQKLALAMNGNGEIAEDKGDDDSVSKAVHDALKARFDKVEGQFNAADRAKIIAEDQVRAFENTQSDLKEKLRAMEKAAEEMRIRIREAEDPSNKEDPSAGKVAELEQQVKAVEQQRNMAQERVKELEKQLADLANGAGAGASELLEAQKRLEEMQKQLKESSELADKMKKEAETAKDELAKEKEKGKIIKPSTPQKVIPEVRSKHGPKGVDQGEFDALKKQFEDERDRAKLAEKSAQQGKDDLARAQAELGDVRAKYETSEARAKKAETRASEAERDADKFKKEAKTANDAYSKAMEEVQSLQSLQKGPKKQMEVPKPQEVKPRTPRQVQGVPQEEFDKMMAEMEKFKERARKYKGENDELKEANSKLEEKQMKLLKMLHDIKEQLARVTEIAERKGLGDVIKKILQESKVSETLESEEYSCFNRLYDDAKRRQEKQRKLQAEKFGTSVSDDRFHKFTPHQHQMAGQSLGGTSDAPTGPGSDFQNYGYSSSQDNLQFADPARTYPGPNGYSSNQDNQRFADPARTYPGPNGMSSMGSMSFSGPGQHMWQGGGGSNPGSSQPSPMHGRGENLHSTWHPGHSNTGGGGGHPGSSSQPSPMHGRGENLHSTWHAGNSNTGCAASGPFRSAHPEAAAGNLYATGSNFHRGGMPAAPRDNFRDHPAGALEMPHHPNMRRPFDSFAVNGFNPIFGAPPPPQRLPVNSEAPSFNNHASHPLRHAATATTGAYPSGASSLSSLHYSAMAMDSSSRHRSSSSSPPPPRRLGMGLLESPIHRLGEELPPLAHGALQSSPLTRALASEAALRSSTGLPRLHTKGMQSHHIDHNLHRSAGRLSGQDHEPTWRPPPSKHVDDILGRANDSPQVGITGWALSGHGAEGIAP